MIKKNTNDNYLDVLQIFRVLAALMVVVHHSVGSLNQYNHLNSETLNFIGELGKYGVDFFFVLSGFIISYSSYFKYNKPDAFKNYILNRIIRIYIPYIPIGYLMLFLYTNYPSFSHGDHSGISLLSSLTLLPHGGTALGVAWTLVFEIFFYFLFSITFISKKIWNYFVIFWISCILGSNYLLNINSLSSNALFSVFLSMYNIEFILGYILSIVFVEKRVFNKYLLLVLCGCSFSIFLISQYLKIDLFIFSRNMLFSIAIFSMLYLIITLFNIKIYSKSIFMLIGNSTFSIYLIHNPLKVILIRYCPHINSVFGNVLILLFVLIMTCIVGYIYFIIFERYFVNKMKLLIFNK